MNMKLIISMKTSIAIAGVLLPTMLLGAEWSMNPRINVNHSYNDNYRMERISNKSVSITVIQPSLDFGWSTDQANIHLNANWNDTMYSGDMSLVDHVTKRYSLSSKYSTELNTLSLGASLTKDTTLTPGENNESLGLVTEELDRNIWNISPGWIWRMTEISSLQVGYSYQQAEYEKYYSSSLNDYDSGSISMTYSYNWTEKDQLSIYASHSHYEMDDRSNENVSARPISGDYALSSESDTDTYQLSVNHNFSETSKVGISYGSSRQNRTSQSAVCIQIIDSRCVSAGTYPVSQRESTTPVYKLTATHKFELTNLNFVAERKISASGLVAEGIFDTASINVNHKMSSLLNLDISISGEKSRSTDNSYSVNDRNYMQGNIKLAWNLYRQLTLSGSYKYSKVEYINSNFEAESNFYGLSLNYSWDGFSVSI